MKLHLTFLFLALIAVVEPWIHGARMHPRNDQAAGFPGWSSAPVPVEVLPLTLGRAETEFARDFPGKIGVFTDGKRRWVVRWVRQPTRKLHPSSDCFRAAGYAIEPTSAYSDADGALWSVFVATRDRERLCCRERIVCCAEPQRGWSDVSAWYWNAVFDRGRGPWWAVTVIEDK